MYSDNNSVSFKKQIASGGKECCPYDNRDCCRGGKRDSTLDLHVNIIFYSISGTIPTHNKIQIRFGFNKDSPFESTEKYVVHCDGGGAITILGSSIENIRYVCNRSNGATEESAFIQSYPL